MIAKLSNRLISFLKAWFGDFTREELKKFIKLGVIFAIVIGVYWTLRPLKDSIFSSMVHADNQPLAKVLSLIVMFPLVIIYSKLVDKFKRHRLFYVLGGIFCLGTIIFGLLFLHPTIGLENTTIDASRYVAWAWYVFVESYGSLVVALFWAFAADTVDSDSAKRGFPIVVMIGQLGSIFGPYYLTPLGKEVFGTSALTVIICGGLILFLMAAVYLFMKTTPRSQLEGYHDVKGAEKEEEPGFFEGLKLLVKEPYLMGIFGIIAIYEMIITVIDFNFKYLVFSQFDNEAARSAYLGDYAVWVNVISFFCLLFGISNIQRRLGLTVSLVLMPFVVLAMVISFKTLYTVKVIFWIMVAAKAVNYALNGPAQKTLYVPLNKDTRYKASGWIESFGSRGSKAAGSGLNFFKKILQAKRGLIDGLNVYLLISVYFSVGLIGLWIFIAYYLGKTYEKAVAHKRIVC